MTESKQRAYEKLQVKFIVDQWLNKENNQMNAMIYNDLFWCMTGYIVVSTTIPFDISGFPSSERMGTYLKEWVEGTDWKPLEKTGSIVKGCVEFQVGDEKAYLAEKLLKQVDVQGAKYEINNNQKIIRLHVEDKVRAIVACVENKENA